MKLFRSLVSFFPFFSYSRNFITIFKRCNFYFEGDVSFLVFLLLLYQFSLYKLNNRACAELYCMFLSKDTKRQIFLNI